MSDNGWTRILRRENGAVEFDRLWIDYRNGFGDVTTEHYLGNDVISQLTSSGSYKLQVDLTLWSGNQYSYAQYSTFTVGPESSSYPYRLNVNGYSGTAGEQLIYHNSQRFATNDYDTNSCASSWTGGWWYYYCTTGHLTAKYAYGGTCNQTDSGKCISWGSVSSSRQYKEVTMKIQGTVVLQIQPILV